MMVGSGASVTRAVSMAGLSFLAAAVGRTYDLPTAMCIPAAGLLLAHSLAFFWDTGLRGVLKSNCDPAYDVCGHIGISWTRSVFFIRIGWGCDAWRRALYFEIL